jgi:HK97 gp10 family phage protein
MARAGVKDNDLGWGEIQKQIKLAKDSFVLVGFQQGSKTKAQSKGTRTKQGGLSMPEIAAANEFGTDKIPARPFMTTAFDENRSRINDFTRKEYDKIISGKQTTERALGRIGIAMVGLIQKKIRQIIYPPLAPSTIKAKGSSKPLIDFGQMIQSVREKVVLQR